MLLRRLRLWLPRLRPALIAVLALGLLGRAPLAAPPIPSWAAAAICGAGAGDQQTPAPVGAVCDHCPFCHALTGAALLPTIVALPSRVMFGAAPALLPRQDGDRAVFYLAYASRAPPLMV